MAQGERWPRRSGEQQCRGPGFWVGVKQCSGDLGAPASGGTRLDTHGERDGSLTEGGKTLEGGRR